MTTTSAAASFINIGERTNVTGSAKFRKLIEAGDYSAALAGSAGDLHRFADQVVLDLDWLVHRNTPR